MGSLMCRHDECSEWLRGVAGSTNASDAEMELSAKVNGWVLNSMCMRTPMCKYCYRSSMVAFWGGLLAIVVFISSLTYYAVHFKSEVSPAEVTSNEQAG
jgi:hypothetical protein